MDDTFFVSTVATERNYLRANGNLEISNRLPKIYVETEGRRPPPAPRPPVNGQNQTKIDLGWFHEKLLLIPSSLLQVQSNDETITSRNISSNNCHPNLVPKSISPPESSHSDDAVTPTRFAAGRLGQMRERMRQSWNE